MTKSTPALPKNPLRDVFPASHEEVGEWSTSRTTYPTHPSLFTVTSTNRDPVALDLRETSLA